jgi:hypothetical protein
VAGDVEIAQQIASQLKAQKDASQLKGFHIGVKVESGKVWMKGQVSDAQQQMLALDVARRVPGVQVVVNELHVVPANSLAATTARTSTAAAPVQTPTAVPAATALQLRQPASAANFNAMTAQTPYAAPAMPQPMLTQPQVAIPAQSAAIAPYALATQATEPVPVASGYASSVPSLTVSPQVATATTGFQQMPAAPSIQTAAVPAQPTAAGTPRPIARVAMTQVDNIPSSIEMQPAMPVSAQTAAAAIGSGATGGIFHDHPNMPGYAWPSYASHPNYAAVTYPQQYSPTAWPYIGPFYPYPQVPLGWRKVTLEWDDGWWFLDFTSK